MPSHDTEIDAREGQAGRTKVARIELRGGSCDALCAEHFSRVFPPHFHDTFAIGVVEDGTTVLRTHRGEWIARAGSILALSPGEVHGAVPFGGSGYTYRIIYPSRELVESVLARRVMFRAPVIHDDDVACALLRGYEPLMSGQGVRSAESRLIDGLHLLVSRHGTPMQDEVCESVRELRRADLEMVERAKHYFLLHLAEPVHLETVASMCGITSSHFIRTFRRIVGVPPYAYFVQLRVNRAQQLLCNGAPITEVAYECGFSDQAHLTRTFRKAVGVPPGQYVRQAGRVV